MNVSIRFVNLKHCSSNTFPTTGGNWRERINPMENFCSDFMWRNLPWSKYIFFLIILNLFRIIIDKLIEHEIPLMPFGIWLFAKKPMRNRDGFYFKQVRHSSIYGINSWKCHCETQSEISFYSLDWISTRILPTKCHDQCAQCKMPGLAQFEWVQMVSCVV